MPILDLTPRQQLLDQLAKELQRVSDALIEESKKEFTGNWQNWRRCAAVHLRDIANVIESNGNQSRYDYDQQRWLDPADLSREAN